MGVAHTRVQLLGTLIDGAEEWSCSFSTVNPGGGAIADVADLSLTAATLFQSEFWGISSIEGTFPNSVYFIGARVTQMDASGATMASAETLLSTPTNGTQTEALPPQCAIVVSLVTGFPGARGRGRMYLPTPGIVAVDTRGRITAASRDEIAARMRDFFNQWNSDPGTFPVAVASDVGEQVATVNSIRVGNIVDTQRRRRDQLPEVYKAENII